MTTEQYDEKRGPNMGSRTIVRHGAEGAASAGGLALVLQALVDYGTLDIKQAFIALAVLTPVVTTFLKAWSALKLGARLSKFLDDKLGAVPIILALLIPLAGGCAIQLGTMEPKQFSTLGGGTMIACDTKGITIAIGDADLCSNSARGGHVSKTFADMTLGVMRTAGAIVAGFFGGAGAGVQAALAPEVPATSLPEPSASAPVSAPENAPSRVDLLTPTNPFTAPR